MRRGWMAIVLLGVGCVASCRRGEEDKVAEVSGEPRAMRDGPGMESGERRGKSFAMPKGLTGRAAYYAKYDPVAGVRWLEEMTPDDDWAAILESFTRGVLDRGQDFALGLFDRFSPGRARDAYSSRLYRAVAESDPELAWKWLAARRAVTDERSAAFAIVQTELKHGVERAWRDYAEHVPAADRDLFAGTIYGETMPDRLTPEDLVFTLGLVAEVREPVVADTAMWGVPLHGRGDLMPVLEAELARREVAERWDRGYMELADHFQKTGDVDKAAKWTAAIQDEGARRTREERLRGSGGEE